MDASTITCPKCQHEFALTAAIERPIVEKLKASFAAQAAQRDAEIAAREAKLCEAAEKLKRQQESLHQQVETALAAAKEKLIAEQQRKAKEEVGLQLEDLQNQLAEKSKKLGEAQQTQLALLKEKRAFEEEKQAFELEKSRQIEAERERIRAEAKQAAQEESTRQMSELQEKLAAKDKKLAESEQAELELRKQKLEFEEQKRAFDLEMIRQAEQVRDLVRKQKDEEFRLKEAEAIKKEADLKAKVDELQRKLEQGSQQAQGEVLELDLETALRNCFDGDELTPVPKGVHGGDIVQLVRSEMGQDCGHILWESKRTKAWSELWLQKLKDDKLKAKAQLAVLVSTAMPKDVATFECRQGVWVTPPQLAVPLAAALRHALIEVASARRAIEGRHDKIEVVYAYLSGPEFKGRVNAIVEAFTAMRKDLVAERNAMEKIWAKREKQIDRVLTNTAGMYGDLSGIIGSSMPAIANLELAALADGSADGDASVN